MSDNGFEPLIIGFCCNWCAYAGADLAGVSRTAVSGQHPHHPRDVFGHAAPEPGRQRADEWGGRRLTCG